MELGSHVNANVVHVNICLCCLVGLVGTIQVLSPKRVGLTDASINVLRFGCTQILALMMHGKFGISTFLIGRMATPS